MHFKIVGKLLLPKGKGSKTRQGEGPNAIAVATPARPVPLLTLNSISQPGQATIFYCCCCWRWRCRCRRFFILSVRANCCNEITTKFSVCCIIKKFEKLLPKPGNNQRRATAPCSCYFSCPCPGACCSSSGQAIINQRLCSGCSFCMIDNLTTHAESGSSHPPLPLPLSIPPGTSTIKS